MPGLEGSQMKKSERKEQQGRFVFEPIIDSNIPEKKYGDYTIREKVELIRIIKGVVPENLSDKLRRFREEYYRQRQEEIEDRYSRPDGKSQP